MPRRYTIPGARHKDRVRRQTHAMYCTQRVNSPFSIASQNRSLQSEHFASTPIAPLCGPQQRDDLAPRRAKAKVILPRKRVKESSCLHGRAMEVASMSVRQMKEVRAFTLTTCPRQPVLCS